jgi:hypothetical protein
VTADDFKWLQQLIYGAYLFAAGCYAFGFFILRSLYRIDTHLSHLAGVSEGQDLDHRVTRLERQWAERKG